MEGLPGENLKAIINELFVFAVDCPFADAVSSITHIAKEGVPDMFHMDPYLVGPACFQPALHKSNVAKTFHNPVMGHGMPAGHPPGADTEP